MWWPGSEIWTEVVETGGSDHLSRPRRVVFAWPSCLAIELVCVVGWRMVYYWASGRMVGLAAKWTRNSKRVAY
jgi:hypothetical protein